MSLKEYMDNMGLNTNNRELTKLPVGWDETQLSLPGNNKEGWSFLNTFGYTRPPKYRDENGKPVYKNFEDNKYRQINFAEIPYFKKTGNEAFNKLATFMKIKKDIEGDLSLSQYKNIFDKYVLDEKLITAILELVDDNEEEMLYVYLALVLEANNNSAYVRDLFYDLFPELVDVREKTFKILLDFHEMVALEALYQIPRTKESMYFRFFLSLENLGSRHKKDQNGNIIGAFDGHGVKKPPYDVHLVNTLLTGGYREKLSEDITGKWEYGPNIINQPAQRIPVKKRDVWSKYKQNEPDDFDIHKTRRSIIGGPQGLGHMTRPVASNFAYETQGRAFRQKSKNRVLDLLYGTNGAPTQFGHKYNI